MSSTPERPAPGWRDRLAAQWQAFEEFAVDVVYERRDGRAAEWLGAFLRGLSEIFSLIVQLRLWLYRHRYLRDHPLGCLVLVVGNLTVGGTGKTPIVEKLARTLHDRGRTVAILSRGYKSRPLPLWRRWYDGLRGRPVPPPRVVSDLAGMRMKNAAEAGDEPFMLARNLPGIPVIVDKDRVKAGLYAIRHFGVDTLILDDGFQYLRLKNHLHLLLIDKTNPFGNGHLLPRGVLREPVKHLRRASYIFLTKSDGRRDPELEEMIREHKPGAELIECTHRPRYLREVFGTGRRDLSALAGRKVAAFCGIAVPDGFAAFLRQHGAELVHHRWYLDHHHFTSEEREAFHRDAVAAGAEWIVTTEKDAVRLDPNPPPPLPLFYLRVEIELLSGAADFEAAVDRICGGGRRSGLNGQERGKAG